jgi:hypothetical protein
MVESPKHKPERIETMGYTHYWTQKSRFSNSAWAEAVADMTAILETAADSGLVIGDNFGERNIEGTEAVDGDSFGFNGMGPDSHETFYIGQDRAPLEDWQKPSQRGWAFCKTARKPYDVAVTACLIYLESVYPEKISVSSDGRADDWEAGLALARAALPRLDNVLTIPAEVRFDSLFSRVHFSGGKLALASTVSGDLCLIDSEARAILGRFTSSEAIEWVTTWIRRVADKRQSKLPARLDYLSRWEARQLRTFREAAESFGYLTPETVDA